MPKPSDCLKIPRKRQTFIVVNPTKRAKRGAFDIKENSTTRNPRQSHKKRDAPTVGSLASQGGGNFYDFREKNFNSRDSKRDVNDCGAVFFASSLSAFRSALKHSFCCLLLPRSRDTACFHAVLAAPPHEFLSSALHQTR